MRWLLLSLLVASASSQAQEDRPNILLLITDDLGYADLGVHGSDIRTPNIDALAEDGLLFTQFHASPICSTTRAMLLSGNNNHVAGLARQGIFPGPVIPGLAGYENELSDRVALLPRLLSDSGYRTYLAGKWHLGALETNSPAAAGFERSYAMVVGGAASHFRGTGVRPGGALYRDDDRLVDWPDGEYSTAVYTDRLIAYLEADLEDERPFFMVAAYTSPHWPLQVPDEDLDLYAGHYEMGYDLLRERNFEALKRAGIVPNDSVLPARNAAVTPFDDLSADEKRRESRKMEIYAAMVENLDRHVGRLLDYLRDSDQYDDTLIVFMSDNGAAGEDFYYEGPPALTDYIREHYNDDYDEMGRYGNFVSYGPQWAEAGEAPFRLYKGYPTQGGIVAPMIVAGPGVERGGGMTNIYLTVMDLMPTFLDIAGAAYPEDKSPMLGSSARAFFAGTDERVHDEDYVTTMAYSGGSVSLRTFMRQGSWKLLSYEEPFEERHFELFNLANDPGEANELSREFPEKREEMIDLWRIERRKLGIVLPEDL